MKKVLISVLGLCAGIAALAQSQSFKLGQWSEIHNSVVRNVVRYYVDSLPVEKMFRDGIDKMLADLDPYTVYIPESEQEDFQMMISNTYGGIGAIIYKPTKESNVVINEPYEGSPAARSGLRCGDEIIKIDGQSVQGLIAGEASSRMKGKAGTNVVFTVKKVRSGEVVDYTIRRERIHLPDIQYSGMISPETGYICISSFTDPDVDRQIASIVKDLKTKGMKRMVIDLRGNGGGIMEEAIRIVGLFVPKGTLVVTAKGPEGEQEYRTTSDPIDTKLPLMVMVDSGSASASEIVSGALQDLDRATIAGQRTYGKGLVQRVMPVAYNGQLKVTVAKYYTPSGRCVQAKDYAHRKEDGSVGNIPDSLIREFKTAGGRTVRDGGGITPDLLVDGKDYNRITYAVAMSGIAGNYAIEFCRNHDGIGPLEDFRLSDEEYEAFAVWAAGQEFDSRSESETYFDMMVKQLRKDKMYDEAKASLDALEAIVKMDRKEALMRSRDMIRPLVEEEIAVRYYFQKAGIEVRLRTDDQLHEALRQWK